MSSEPKVKRVEDEDNEDDDEDNEEDFNSEGRNHSLFLTRL